MHKQTGAVAQADKANSIPTDKESHRQINLHTDIDDRSIPKHELTVSRQTGGWTKTFRKLKHKHH